MTRAANRRNGAAAWLRRAVRDAGGGAAVEFAVLSPLLALLLAAAADFGGVVYMQLRVESAVSAAANYAIVNSNRITSAGAEGLARDLAAIVALNASGARVDSVVVNNAATASMSGETVASGGLGGSADACYCPTLAGGQLAWGAQRACSAVCDDGARAGKFVVVRATQPYTPLFSGYGIIRNGAIAVNVRLQTQ